MSAETNIPIDINENNNQLKTPQPQSPQQQQQKPRNLEVQADGGTVVGLGKGALTCNIHEGFSTFNKAEFDQHCIDNPEGHMIIGQQGCITCKNIIEIPEDQGGVPVIESKSLQCPECFERAQSQHQNFKQSNKIRIRKAPEQVIGEKQ